jgi:flagellar hook-associated protein 3 FlgL
MSVRMPVLTQFKTQLDEMSRQYDRASNLQIKVASGKKLQSSSDDPLLASKIQSVQEYVDRLSAYDSNSILAKNRISLACSVMQRSNELCIKAQELVVQAQNSSLNDSDRATIALSLTSILDSMSSIANTQDADGSYIFNGFANGPAFAQVAGQYQYQGTYEGASIAIADKVHVLYNESGAAIFGNIPSGSGQFSVSASANNSGSGILESVTSSNANIVRDDYNVTMLTNQAGQLAYQVTDVTTGQVLIPVAPADAPAYVAGNAVIFNGLSIQLNGEPKVGDQFMVTPSKPQSVFQTLQNVIAALKTPLISSATSAQVHQQLIEQSSSLKGALNHLVDQTTRFGERAKQIDLQININADTTLQQRSYLSALADVDLPEVISSLSLQLTSLEMSQQSYSKIHEFFSQLMSRQF